MGMETPTEPCGACTNPDKGDDSADRCGGCCQAGGEEESEGGTRRWGGRKTSMAINICHHQNLALLALQPPQQWRGWSEATGEGAAPAAVLETQG